MEGKYGRLFTERDVLTIVAGVLLEDEAKGEVGPEMAEALIAGAIESAERLGRMTFPRDEPLFLLRGQDVAAPFAIASAQPKSTGIDYAQSCLNAGAPESHLRAVWEAAAAMRDWQAANPARVKVPD